MAKGNVNPNPSPSPNPNPAPNPTPSPSPTGTGGTPGPTGNSGFSVSDSSMSGLQNKAGDLGSRLSSISSGLRGLNFSGNALGPIGLFAVPALNASNENAVSQADKGAKAFTDVQSNLKATQQTFVDTDTTHQKNFQSFDTSTNAKPPPGAGNFNPGLNSQGGPNVKGPETVKGGGNFTPGLNSQGGPNVKGPEAVKGGGVNTPGLNTQGGPNVKGATPVKGGANFTPSLANTPGGPNVGTTPNVKGGGANFTPSLGNTPGGPNVGATPNVKGGSGVTPSSGGGKTPGGPSVGTTPNVKGGPAPFTPSLAPPPGGASPNVKGGAPGGKGGPAPFTPSLAPPPGGTTSKPGTTGGKGPAPFTPSLAPPPGGTTSKPGTTPGAGATPGSGGKGPAPFTPSLGNTPGSSAGGPKPGVTPPGPQNAVTSPSTSGTPRGVTPGTPGTPGASPGMAPPMGGTPGGAQTGGERGGSKFGTGGGKGVFDAPKPPTPDSTITKAPGTSPSTPPPAPKPTGATPGATPGSSGKGPAPFTPSMGPAPATTPTTPGTQSAVTSPSTGPNTSPTPGTTPPASANPGAAAPPMAPGGANPGATGGERGGNKFGQGPGVNKGAFDAPKPPTPDNTITRAPGTSPSTPPPAPKPTPLTPPPVSSPSTNTPSTNTPNTATPPPAQTRPAAGPPPVNVPNTNAPSPNTAPPVQSRPAPAAPPVNAPSPAPNVNTPSPNPATNAPSTNVPPANTPSPRPDTAPNTQTPKADTTPAQTRPAPATPTPAPAANVPPAATPSPAPSVNTPSPNPAANIPPVTTPPANPAANVPPPNTPSPKPDTAPNTQTPKADTPPAQTRPAPASPTPNVSPAPAPNVNTPSPNPAANVPPPANTPAPNPNTPPVNAPNPNPATNTPNPGDSAVRTRPAPAANVPSTSTNTNTNTSPDVVVVPPVVTPAPNTQPRSGGNTNSDTNSDAAEVQPTAEQRVDGYRAPNQSQDSRYQPDPAKNGDLTFQPNKPSDIVGIRVEDGKVIGLTPYMTKQWLADNGITLPPRSGIEASVIPMLYDPNAGGGNRKPETYDIDNAADFHADLIGLTRDTHIQSQQNLVNAVNDVANHITTKYPPNEFTYVGLGRSPAAVVAALQNQGHEAVSIPLSNFRPPPADPNSILAPSYEAHGGKVPPLTPDQQTMLNQHFDEFLGDLPDGKNVVLIDYTQGGLSLVSAQHHLQQYLTDTKGPDVKVNAFAMHQEIDSSNLGKTVNSATTPQTYKDAIWEAVWDTDRKESRAEWDSRFESYPIEQSNPLGDAFRQEAFDNLAEHGSYKILDEDPANYDPNSPHGEKYFDPGDTPAYEVLGDAVREGSPTPAPAGPDTDVESNTDTDSDTDTDTDSDSDSDSDNDNDQNTRSAPPPPSNTDTNAGNDAPTRNNPGDTRPAPLNDTDGNVDSEADVESDADAEVDADVAPATELDNQLGSLVTDARQNANPQAQQVAAELKNEGKYLQHQAANHLLDASVVLDTKTDDIAAMIEQHGIESVAQAFNKQFERPIIENAQIEQFANITDPNVRQQFDNWAHGLWDTVGNTPEYQSNPGKLAEDIFNHDKGYNRANNFAQEAAYQSMVGPTVTPLTDSVAKPPPNDVNSQANWTLDVLGKAGLVPTGAMVPESQFTAAVNDNKAVLETALGPLDETRIDQLREELSDWGLLAPDTQSDTQTNTDTDTADADPTPSTSNTQPDTSRGAPPNTPPPAPPAPASPTPSPAPTIKSGGAPPKMTPPTPESHAGKDVRTDQTWRHDPARTADWSQPNNPADRSTWAGRRNDTDVRTVDQTVHDVRTDSTPSNIKSYQGLINYDLRRIETTPGNFVQEYTVKVHVDPAANTDPKLVEQVKQNATNGVNNLLNQGFRLPSGDQFHLNLEFTNNPADAHTSIKVDPNNPNVDQTHWNPDTSPEVLAHETLHYLGIPDEYKDTSRVFQQHDTNSGVHQNDGGLMGADVHLPDPGIRPRHLWLIENTANSQVMVPDTTINPAGPATVPPPAGWTPPAATPDTSTTPPNVDSDTNTNTDSNVDSNVDSDVQTRPVQTPDTPTMPGAFPADTNTDTATAAPTPPTPQEVRAGLEASLSTKSSAEINQTISQLYNNRQNDGGLYDAAQKAALIKRAAGHPGGPQGFVNDLAQRSADLQNRIDEAKSKSTWKPEALQTKQDRANEAAIKEQVATLTDLRDSTNSQIDALKDAGTRPSLVHAVDTHVAGPNADGLAKLGPTALAQLDTHLTAEIAAAERAGYDPKDLKALQERVQNEGDARAAMAQISRHGVEGLTAQVDTANGLLQEFRETKEDFTGFNGFMNSWFGDGRNFSAAEVDARIADAEALVKQSEQQLSFATNPEYSNRVAKAEQMRSVVERLDRLRESNTQNIERTAQREAAEQARAQELQAAQERREALARQEEAAFKASLFGKTPAELDALAEQNRDNQTRSYEIDQMSRNQQAAQNPGGLDQHMQDLASQIKDTQTKIGDLKHISDSLPDAFKTELMRTDQAQRQAEQNRLALHEMELNSELLTLKYDRNDALTAYALNLPADLNAPGWQSLSPKDIVDLEAHVTKLTDDANAAGQPNPQLDRLRDQLSGMRIDIDTAFGLNENNAPAVQVDDSASVHSDNDADNNADTDAQQDQPAPAPEPRRPERGPFMQDPSARPAAPDVDVTIPGGFGPIQTGTPQASFEASLYGLDNTTLREMQQNPAYSGNPDRAAAIQNAIDTNRDAAAGPQLYDRQTESAQQNLDKAKAARDRWNASDMVPDALKTQDMLDEQAARREIADREVQRAQNRVDQLTNNRDAALTSYALQQNNNPTSYGWRQFSDADIAAVQTHVEQQIQDAQAGGHPTQHLTDLLDFTHEVQDARAQADADTQTRSAPPEPEVQTRPAPWRPTPNPAVPMTTVNPQPVGQVPDTNLPSFFQDNKALGSIIPTDVRGADAVVNEIQGLKPNDQARIKDALENDFETFLGNGRNFQVKIGGSWFEANVRAEMHADANTTVTDAADSKVDKNFQAAAASTTTNTIATSNDVGGSATAGVAMGPYGSLGGKAALATPAVSQATTNTITEQRAIKSDGGSKQVTVPVSFEITVNDAAGNPVQFATLSTGPDVTLQVPTDLSTIVDSGKTSDVVTPTDADWGVKVENAVPEAVTVKDSGKAFNDVAAKLHPSITKVGSPGREVLQNFLSPTSIRNNLPAMLGGFVTSPDLISPHASKGGAVQMSATLKDAKLVGTHDTAVLDLKDTSAWGSSVSAATKTGFDVTGGFGGNLGVPGKVGGTVGATLNYSARTAEGVSAGSSTNRKTGIGVKNETGLYEVTAEVEVRTPAGDSVKMEVTTHMRMGLNEAGAVGLPTPDGSRNTITDPATADTKYLPPYLADTLAAGNAKVGEFVPATQVQSQVETKLRELPGFEKFLPQWNNPDANPRSSKGQSFSDVAEQLANQRKLTANLSPDALKANMDSLLGPGVQVQLKNSGKTTNTYVNVTVKAKVSNPKHLGQADARPVSDSTTTGPKLDSNTTTTKGWTGGVQGRVNIPVKTGVASLTPMPQLGVSYTHSNADKTSAGPAVSSTASTPGSADAQVFQQDVEFEVEITTFTRPRTWVRNIVPGAPGFHSPEVTTVAKTGAGLDKIDGKVNLWVSDGSTLKTDPGDGFKPGDPQSTKIDNSPTVKDLLNPKDPRPKSPEFLNVEAVANTTELRDQAIDALNRAANGDSALTTPGTASRAQIDKMFTPENIKANLQRLIETGVQEQGLKYDRRVTDRSGAIGMSVKLGDAKLVSISDTTGADNSVSGGYKAGESSTTSRSVDVTAGINIPVRPNVTPPPAGTPSQPSGSGGAAVTGKVTPWSDTKTEASEIGGNVDRGKTTPGDARTVLVQIDAEFTIVGESRAGNFVHGGTPNAEGVTVNMPKSVFVRVSEDVARDLGVLPKVESTVPKPDFPKMAPPSTVAVGEPGALGLSTVESVPNLSGVVNDLTSQLSTNTKKFGSDALIPDSVLKDSMSNLQRIVDLNSPASVKAMIDSAMDGGVPLLVHQPGTFGKDSYQVTLRAKAGEPTFNGVVNDGVDMTHNNGGSRKESAGQGRGSGWGVGVRAPGLAAPGSANPNVSGTAGGAVGANIGGSKSSSVTTSVNEAFSNTRTASGPAAQYTVPVEFELVVEKGSKEIAKAKSGDQEMVVRTHADNQKVSQPTTGHGNPQPYMSAASKRGAEFGTPEATFAFQQDSRATQLPPTASVENLRGAQDLRDAAVKALTEAGAGKGLTGKGTGSLNSLLATLSPENLQPHLPSMLSGSLDVPGLKEAALTFGQDADVKVYAKLVNPQLGSLSDSVKIESPLTTKTSETSSEAKKSDTADVSVGLAQGSAAVKQGDPKDTVNFGTGGVEAKHANEDSSAVSGGPAQAEGGNIKPKDTPRTGLVQFDVEYRVVATIGGKTGVVDLTVPGSAGVRMPDSAVETVLDHQLGDSLKDAQTEVKKAADDWRTAEKEVEAARHEAQDAINEAAAVLARTDQPIGDAATALNTAIDAHLDAEAKLPALEAAAANTQAEVASTRAHIQELNPQITSLSQDALSTKDALDDAQINGAPQAELDRLGQEADAAHNALTDAQQQLTEAHSDLDAQRKAAADARAELQAQQQVVARADQARADAEAAHQKLTDERAAAEKAITDAETKLDDARRTADAKQQEWWNAKAKVDNEIDSFNTAAQAPPPVPPKDGDTSTQTPPVTTNDTSASTSTTPPPGDTSASTSTTPPPVPPKDEAAKPLPPLPPESSAEASTSRSAPPAAPPAPPLPDSDTRSSTVRSGGAPPAMPTSFDHRGKDVLTDESWRHDPAKTADWFAPSDPADRSTWADRRDDKNVRTVNQVVHDIRTDSTPSNLKSYKGLINYDLRRIETSPGNFVQEYTVKVHIDPAANTDPKLVEQVKQDAAKGVNDLLNQGHRLPSGDQFHLNLEFTDNKADAHTTVRVDPKNPNVDQTHWQPGTSPEVLAHETLHYLGIPDEYSDSSRVFQQHDTSSGVHQNDGGMMGTDVRGNEPGLRPRHLWLVERTANSQVAVPDTTLNPAGPATVPVPEHLLTNAKPSPAPAPQPNTAQDVETGTRPMKHRRDEDSDTEIAPTDDRVTKRGRGQATWSEPGPSNRQANATADTNDMDVDADSTTGTDAQHDSQTDALADQLSTMSIGDLDPGTKYNDAFARLGDGRIEVPTKDTYLDTLKTSVEQNKRPSFVISIIVSHNDLGDINGVIDAITADAGPIADDMVFVIGVNGRTGANPGMSANIDAANTAIGHRNEPIALVPMEFNDKAFPYGKMRNQTMQSSATRFAVGALNGKGTHPYLSIQDFDTGSRRVPNGKDVFTHFTESLNPPEIGPIRPLMHGGGYRVGDPNALITDIQAKITGEQAKLDADTSLDADERAEKQRELDLAAEHISPQHRQAFVAKFEQAMNDDMHARVRQADSAPMTPYWPEPNLFIDATVPLVDPSVKFSDGLGEFNGLGQSMNAFAGKEIVEVHQTKLPAPDTTRALTEAKAQLEADIAARGGEPNAKEARALAEIEAGLEANQDPAVAKASNDAEIDAAISVDLQTNRHPLRGETFHTDFVEGAVGTDLSRLAFDFAKDDGKSWPQSHVELTTVAGRTFGGDPGQAAKKAKFETSPADIRKQFQDSRTGRGGKAPKANPDKPHAQREPQQLVDHTQTGPQGWNPSRVDALKLGWEDKNTLNKAVSAPVPGHGHMGVDPQIDPSTTYPPERVKPAGSKKPLPPRQEHELGHIDPTTKQQKTATVVNTALSDNNSNVTRTFGTFEAILPRAGEPRPDGMYNAVHDALVAESSGKKGKGKAVPSAADLRTNTVRQGAVASPSVTTQIADFRQQHGLANGHLVNAVIEPAPGEIPPGLQGDYDHPVDNTGTPGTELTGGQRAEQDSIDADERAAEKNKADMAELLAFQLLSTELNRPIVVHGPNGAETTVMPLHDLQPEVLDNSTQKDKDKAAAWKPTPLSGPELHIDRHPNPDGRTRYTTHDPNNPPGSDDLGEGPSHRDVDMEDQTRPAPSAPPVDAPTPSHNPLHSTDSSAPWFDPQNPVSSRSIEDARATTPATSWVRGEDAGVFDNTTVGPNGIDMKAWRGPIAYDNRVLDVDGVPVRDFTVRLHLDNGTADVQDRTRAGVEEMFNQGYRLPGGEQFHVTVEFTDNPADAHATINVTDDPEGRANQLTWPAHTDSRRLAHEVGHFLGLRDEYLETDAVKPIFQHQDGKGHVVADNSPMTAGIGKADARLKPRHLELIESRMQALQSHNRPQPEPFESDLPAPNMPKRERPDEMQVDSEGDPTKRRRDDDHVFDEGLDESDVSDVDMDAHEVELVNEGGVHNAAFENLANGQTLTPITAENYLQRTKDSIARNEPPAFVVSMIVRASELDQLNDVINGVMANTGDMDGRVAFVLGVNAASQQDIDTAMAAAAPMVNGRTEPIALVSVPHGSKGFKFGETRNTTLNSNAHEYAVTALAANGKHPYVSVMDFDAGDRRTREGGHVFSHVEQLLHAEEVGPADGPDTPAPLRPLLVGGGYRVAITPEQLHADVLARIDGDTKTNDAQKQAYRDRLNEEGFADRFVHMIDADMHARRTQQGIHPLLPYTPEPNLFFDALVPLADPSVKFGEGAAEFGKLGSSLNKFHAEEIAAHYDPRTAQERSGEVPVDQAKLAAAAEQVRVDVQNNRDPVRGQAFTTDFVSGDTGTDLSRIAYGLITDGKLPQSHTALPNVSERFFDGKPAKKGTAFAEERERLSTGEQRVVEPFRPPAEGQTTTTWNPPGKVKTQLGAPAKNRMNPAVSAPLPPPFQDQQAGVQKEQKVVAAHGIVASDHLNHTLRQVRHLNTDVLRGQNPPPTTDTGLYAAVGAARGVNPAALRLDVVELAARNPAVAKAVADFTVSRPMHDGHMVGALVENVNWHMQPDAKENSGAGNARDLVGHLIATQQQVNVRIHQPGGNPVLLRPMGDAVTETVDIEMVLNGRQVTYRPHRGPQGLHQDEQML